MQSLKQLVCIAADEDQQALDTIKNYINTFQALHLAATFNNSYDLLMMLQQQPVDLLIADIKMPHFSAADFTISIKNRMKIIFTADGVADAIQGFELGAIDFLLKPVLFERFARAINKVTNMMTSPWFNQNGLDIAEETGQFLFLKADRKIIKIRLDDILYVESLKDYLKVVTKNKTIITRKSISVLESELPKNLFVRIHRSFIVAFKSIDCLTRERIEIGKYELPVSRSYRREVESMMQL